MEIRFEKATINDAETLINVRNQSFYADYVKYGECPGYNISKEDMTKSILKRIGYKIICNNQVVGNISITDNQDGTYYLGCLCVIPDYENKGIGQEAVDLSKANFQMLLYRHCKYLQIKKEIIIFTKKWDIPS